jgi:hypothetical protein
MGLAIAALALGATTSQARKVDYKLNSLPCCSYEHISPVVWSGTDPHMTIDRLAAYCGPILWFSPDEPLLQGAEETGILIPTSFPFETKPEKPVVYYRLRSLTRIGDAKKPAYVAAPNRDGSRLDLANIRSIQLDYFFYYPSEEGFGGHAHDVEAVEMTILVWQRPQCAECPYSLVVLKAVAKAHGVLWYDNTLMMDPDVRFPLTLLVEEGKHASCTDKNGDGYYTPGYDVNQRVNDAWGVRDIIRGGGLFSGGFESWFAKVRVPKDRVVPPLPEDSPNRAYLAREARKTGGLAVYELRPFPRPELAASDPHLVPFIADKGSPDWPEIKVPEPIGELGRTLTNKSIGKSLSLSARMDGDLGVSLIFPLFIVKNFNEPLAGGWLVNRVYLKDHRLRDFGYNILYTHSASRWIDGYFSLGVERDEEDDGQSQLYWCAESGFKFRANIRHSTLRFLAPITDFWGIRIGTKVDGLLPVTQVGLVIEVGTGAF